MFPSILRSWKAWILLVGLAGLAALLFFMFVPGRLTEPQSRDEKIFKAVMEEAKKRGILKLGKRGKACEDRLKANQLDPNKKIKLFQYSPSPCCNAYNNYIERGQAFMDKEEYDRAIVDFSEAIWFDPRNPFALNNRGNAYEEKGDMERACADWRKAADLDPFFAIENLKDYCPKGKD